MGREFALLVLGCLSLLCPMCMGQSSVHGNVFREATLGLTYEFPGMFSSKVGDESNWVLLRTRNHSVLWKKNNLSLIAGPPTVYPKSLRVYSPLGRPAAALS